MTKGSGSFTFVLHSHLPWVLNHGRWPHGVDWLNEAAAETYLPLWRVFRARAKRGEPLGVTLGMSPVLCEQLAHPGFHREFVSYLEQKIAAAAADREFCTRTGETRIAALATRWETFYRDALEDFCGPHGMNLVARFRRLEEDGVIEIITCGATHGYFPLLGRDSAIHTQLDAAVRAHRRHFGRAPRGVWLPECAYRPRGTWKPPVESSLPAGERPGIEELVGAHDLRYFFVDRHLLTGGRALGVYADRFDVLRHVAGAGGGGEDPGREHPPYRPYLVGESPTVACFGRDAATAQQVWSGEHGYPGDGAYLDFHKKRFPGGHRYWAVTHPKADLAHKIVYDPVAAEARAPQHADHFVSLVREVLAEAGRHQSVPAVLTAMFDTELFGHWWFEGPIFVGAVLDRLKAAGIRPDTAGAYLERTPPRERVALPEGSWGDGGVHEVWLNDTTRWTWPPLYEAERRMEALARSAGASADPLLDRVLRQAGRELLLLEASDWQFLITTFAARDYAELRFTGHVERFQRLAELAERRMGGGSLSEADVTWLESCETADGLFPDLDWRVYAGEAHAAPAARR